MFPFPIEETGVEKELKQVQGLWKTISNEALTVLQGDHPKMGHSAKLATNGKFTIFLQAS